MVNEKELTELIETHTPSAIRERLESGPKSSYLKDFIYGSIDGIITTFAIVSGVIGAELSSGIIIILGLANLLADGFSMGISNYLGTKSENELIDKAKSEELIHIEHYPEGEKEEIRQIFSRKGFKGDELENAVDTITSDVNRWVETMLQDELGFSLSKKSALKSGFATFIAFIIIGFIPLAVAALNILTTANRFDWSVSAIAAMPRFRVSTIRGLSRTVLSSSEYSECKCRWTNWFAI